MRRRAPATLLCVAVAAMVPFGTAAGQGSPAEGEVDIVKVLVSAPRVPTSQPWFEVILLPNRVYAFYEPGHSEHVNSFLILGESKDLLFDTGMGIGNLRRALEDVRREEGLPERPLMVVNSHAHLDHVGGNAGFDKVHIFETEWSIRTLTTGLAPGGNFVGYWADLEPPPKPPEGFDPRTFGIAAYPRERIGMLDADDVIDLGDRRFEILHTTSHSPDSIVLYDRDNKILFTADTFVPNGFLARDLDTLVADMETITALEAKFHYNTHGAQLVALDMRSHHLEAIRKMAQGKGVESTTVFAGLEMPLYQADGVAVVLAGELLTR